MELDLYKNDGSILFADYKTLKSSNGKSTEAVVSSGSQITGFKQLNSSHVVFVEKEYHCIRVYSREKRSFSRLVGQRGTSSKYYGFVDGASAKFYHPYGVESDERNPGHLLVTDQFNHALRSVDVASGIVSTVIRTGFSNPRGLTWYNGSLLVCNVNYISKVAWSSNGAVTNSKLTTTTSYGYREGDFSTARFNSPYEIQQLRDGLFIIADNSNKKLRLLDMYKKKVLPVCIGSTTSCSTGTSLSINRTSLLITNDTVHVGGNNKILRLTG